ncbi:MAG: hypothetical protein OES24_19750, partial [Acidimicrobiia bacterium]|nr:hypothetical protein [Acidimicrobiia bacterium]
MPDTTPLSIAEQLARYGDAVEAMHGPVDRRHSTNGGPVSVIDLGADEGPATRASTSDDTAASGLLVPSAGRSRLLLIAAVVLLMVVSMAVLVGLLNRPDSLVTDDIDTTTTSVASTTTTSSLTAPDPETDRSAEIDPDAAAVPADLRALSTSTGWVPVAVSMVRWEDGSGDDAADDRHYAT